MTPENCLAEHKIKPGNLYEGVWLTKRKTSDILQPDSNRMIDQTTN